MVTRPDAATPGLRRALRARGLRLLVQPLLTIRSLSSPLPDTTDLQAVVATSARALHGVSAQSLPQPVPVFVVGRAAAAAAGRAGFSDVRPAHDAQTLAAAVRAVCSPGSGPLLYLTGRHRARDLGRMLTGFDLRLAERYATETAMALLPAVRQALARGEVRAVTLYSGRAGRAFANACRRDQVWADARQVQTLCLSRRIAAGLQAQGWRQAWGAPLPQPQRLTTRLLGRRFSPAAPQAQIRAQSGAAIEPQPIRDEAMTDSSQATTDPTADPPSRLKAVAPHWVAIVAVAALAAIALIWLWSELRASTAASDAQAAKAAALSTRIDDLAKIPTFADPVTVDQLVASVADLTKRLDENSQAVAAIGGRVDVTATALDTQLKSQGTQIDSMTVVEQTLTGRTDELAQNLQTLRAQADATKAALTALTATQAGNAESSAAAFASLNASVTGLDQRIGAIEAWVKRAQPVRVAEQLVALAELRRLVEAGNPFAAPLARVKAALADAAELPADSRWPAYAAKGIPTAAGLRQQLAALARDLPRAAPVATGSAWVDGAVGTLLKGVRIGDGPALGADPVADGIRAALAALAVDDLTTADAAVAPIAEKVPAVMEWREVLTARREALAAIAAWDKSVLAGISEASK